MADIDIAELERLTEAEEKFVQREAEHAMALKRMDLGEGGTA